VDNVGISLATVPPTLRQRRLALTAIALVVAAYGAIAPFAAIPLPRIVGFVPVVEGMVFVAELVTAIFLYSQFSVAGSRSVCVLASGYLFSALIVVPHVLTFPGAFGTANFLGAGLQSAGWLPGLPGITGNKAQMLQVILNLLRNAVEALDGVTNRKRVVRIATEYCQDKIAIVVEDSGRGIDAEFADRIFDTFMTTKAAGMGLGLSLCRMIIERHGGSIVASPAMGQGARFDIVLPAARETGLPTGGQAIESRGRVRFKTLDLRPI
jgi:hypothetical protein